MSSWISHSVSSHKAQLITTAVVSGAFFSCAILTFQSIRRRQRVEDLKASIPSISDEHLATKLTEFGAASEVFAPSKEDEHSRALAIRAQQGDYDDELILEQLARNRVFLNDEGLSALRSSFIVVIGLGGVGSHACAALARSGVSNIRLIDFDQVTLSSLNRHAVATLADVGTPKVHTLRRRLEQVAPWVHFDCCNEMLTAQSVERLLGSLPDGRKPDFVIDAIDNIETKVDLLHYCHKNDIPVISSMGAGCKSDPTRIFIGDISASTDDPLSRSVRRRLRLLGVADGVPVVFSSEKFVPGKAKLLPLPDDEFEKGKVGELGVMPDFRVRILPVLGTMPAMFGLTIANHVILEITGYPHEYIASKGREKLYEGVHGGLLGYEQKLARHWGFDQEGLRMPLSAADVGYLIEEVFRGKSVVSGLHTKLALVRWRPPPADFVDTSIPGQKVTKLNIQDVVCMTRDEVAVHEKEVLKPGKNPEDYYDASIVALVKRRHAEEAEFAKFRY
ncbi:hypothetical protein P152DRAFT_435843 [Eremomyces bilateralis CBS 781.70]|uniref:THIF-type NAD/FAD binding fold domain-containing protein n=1 Tax=Eremomyces bilateralis CBS 781.70 TaxID=1392243 RepID=A0A6G1G3M7_9PEZI|nr:uncharacterized protein P152DRAFT_435843 [Eremomyces bilateralis CBS 781.70]KAF1812582.1 hypothetical protein P152DRAFT_435843 [Eremomyces bilateralis CBS 781.70]